MRKNKEVKLIFSSLLSKPVKKLMLGSCVLLILLLGIWSAQPERIRAHAEYDRSEPAAGAVIPESPSEVHVWFTQELFRREGANSLEVFGPNGTQVDQGDAGIDDDDRSHMIVSLQSGLPAGLYTVRWRTLSADDGDTDGGEFTFTVDPDAAQTTPTSVLTTGLQSTNKTPTVAPTPSPTAAPSPTPLPAPTPTAQTRGGLPCLRGTFLGTLALGVVIAPRWRKRGGI